MSTPRMHAELIKAWADGAKIQYYDHIGNRWVDWEFPSWRPSMTYRVKPKTKKYRVALFTVSPPSDGAGVHLAINDIQDDMYEKAPGFSRWLTDWVEYEV